MNVSRSYVKIPQSSAFLLSTLIIGNCKKKLREKCNRKGAKGAKGAKARKYR